jgi:hypothetical protein
MASYLIRFSEGEIVIPPCTVEAPTIEEALNTAWLNNAAMLVDADAEAIGNGKSYRFLRRDGQWLTLATHPNP